MPTTSALSLAALKRLPDQTISPDLISVPETARRIRLHADTLYRLCRTGQFSPAIHIGAYLQSTGRPQPGEYEVIQQLKAHIVRTDETDRWGDR